jgi:hypothetical protein
LQVNQDQSFNLLDWRELGRRPHVQMRTQVVKLDFNGILINGLQQIVKFKSLGASGG